MTAEAAVCPKRVRGAMRLPNPVQGARDRSLAAIRVKVPSGSGNLAGEGTSRA